MRDGKSATLGLGSQGRGLGAPGCGFDEVEGCRDSDEFAVVVDQNAVHALLDVPEERRLLRLSTRTDPDTDMVIVDIKDRGPGIPPKRLERIFQPFFTTKGHGTGLGLHITRGVIEEEGGTITVESTVGKGTTFSIHLPLVRRRSLLDAAAAQQKADGDADSTRVE